MMSAIRPTATPMKIAVRELLSEGEVGAVPVLSAMVLSVAVVLSAVVLSASVTGPCVEVVGRVGAPAGNS